MEKRADPGDGIVGFRNAADAGLEDVLEVVEGLSSREAAKALKVSRSTVQRHLARKPLRPARHSG